MNTQKQQNLSGAHPSSIDDINRTSNMTHQQQQNLSGAHPSTVDDVNRASNMTQTSHPVEGTSNNNPSLWMKNPEAHNNKEPVSAISSTRAEYGSDDNTSHRSPHAGGSSQSPTSRPVADKNAFIQTDETNKHWQNKMTPADRAKELAAEMDHTLNERRKSAEENSKTLKIAGKKEINLQ